MRAKRILAISLILLMLPLCALAQGRAQRVMELIERADFEALYEESSAQLRAEIDSPETFEAVWAELEAVFGAYLGYGAVANTEVEGYEAYHVLCDFERAEATFLFAFDTGGLLAGLQVVHFEQKAVPAADDPGGYIEEPIVLRAGAGDQTRGILTLPETDAPYPCAILMPGSGPSDIDATVYGFAIFRELAHALARNGVASIRYSKYTYAHVNILAQDAHALATLTVDGEYIYDAQAAHDLIAADARIGDIYLVGHSLGAMVAPRAADALDSERIKGAALIAGTPHSLSEIALRQMRDQGMDQAQIDTLAAQFDAMNDMTDAQLQETTALGSPLWYWKDQAGDDPAARILARGLPVLILQGGKDFQVLPAEGIEAWQAALADYEGATYRYYPDMNHMLCDMAGEPTETAADYMELTGISPQLVADIAAWIHEQ